MSLAEAPVPVFVSLEPEQELADLIDGFKRQVRELAGDQLFLGHPPHLTVYLAVYPSAESFRQRWPAEFDRLPPLEIELAGWRVFFADALTDRNTLVCELAEPCKERLRELQERVVARLSPGRDRPATQRRYAARWSALDEIQRRHVKETGFPYIGAGWLPHLTVASIDTDVWPRVWNKLERQAPQGRFASSHLQAYRLVDEHPVPLARGGAA